MKRIQNSLILVKPACGQAKNQVSKSMSHTLCTCINKFISNYFVLWDDQSVGTTFKSDFDHRCYAMR